MSRGAVLVGSLPLCSRFSHVGIVRPAFPCLRFGERRRGEMPHRLVSVLFAPSPSEPKICTGRIKGRAKCK